MAIQRCPYCQSIIDDKAEYCQNCGTRLIVDDEIFKEDTSKKNSLKEEKKDLLEPATETNKLSSTPKKTSSRSKSAKKGKRTRSKKRLKGVDSETSAQKISREGQERKEAQDLPREERKLKKSREGAGEEIHIQEDKFSFEEENIFKEEELPEQELPGEERKEKVSSPDETEELKEKVGPEMLTEEKGEEGQEEQEDISTEELLEHLEPIGTENVIEDKETSDLEEKEYREEMEVSEVVELLELEEEPLHGEGGRDKEKLEREMQEKELEEEVKEGVEEKEQEEKVSGETKGEKVTETEGAEAKDEEAQERSLFGDETLIFPPEAAEAPDFKTEDLEKLVDPAEKEKEEIERFLESLKKEREEKRHLAEKTTGIPPWVTSLKEKQSEEEKKLDEEEINQPPELEEEEAVKLEKQSKDLEKMTFEETKEVTKTGGGDEKTLFPLEEKSTTETVGFPETVTQTGFSFSSYEEKIPSGLKISRINSFLSWIKALAFDLLFIAFFWVVAILVTSSILKVNSIRLVSSSPWKMVALYLIFLVVYLFLFITFIGETLGRQLFPTEEE